MLGNYINENAAGAMTRLPGNPKFPEGLRVLVVDDDPVTLRTLSVMLQQCKYRATLMTNATEALALLRMNRDNYDIVMTDVQMPEMDGLELLRIIRLQMDIPVIMISVDDKTETVMKGVRNGARDYLVKPIRMMELKNIWQHVMRKTEFNPEKASLMTAEMVTENLPLQKRRGKDKEKEDGNALTGGSSSMKKRRFVWTSELHQKFVDAVHRLGADKAVPRQILEVMKEPHLTRENVASHLQKYRNYLKREQDKLAGMHNSNSVGIHETILNPTPTSYSEYELLPILGEANNGGSSVNQQSLWSQQNYLPSHMSNQAQATRPVSVLGNKPLAQPWVPNPPARMMLGNYADMSSQIHNFGPLQSGPQLGFANFDGQSGHSAFPPCKLPPTEHASHPGPTGAFGNIGAPYQMGDGASTQSSQSFQRNVLPGQLDGRVISTAFNGGVGSDFRGYTVDSQAMDNNNHNSLSSMGDELSTVWKQIAPTSTPMK